MLEVRDVVKTYGGFVATNNVSLSVAQGETHAVIGPNGAGKTTLFNIVSGLIAPDSGSVTFRGKPLRKVPAHKIVELGMARSFQRVNVFPRGSLFENVQTAFIARDKLHFHPFRRARDLYRDEVHELLDLVGLVDDPAGRAGDLAYGKQKQLELAVALAADPRFLLLDEPTAGMSARETRDIINLINDIVQKRELTLLFTEHDMKVVYGIADRISVLHHGEIIATGTPEAIRENPEVRSIYLGTDDNDAA